MFCRNCGKAIDDGQEYCEDCKKIINQAANNAQTNDTQANNTQANNTQNVYDAQPINNQQTQNASANNNPEAKSKLAAGLLGILLGSLGVHNFYLGYTGKGIAQLLISLLSCGTLAIASEIWGLIEGIMILTGSINVDAKGIPLKD